MDAKAIVIEAPGGPEVLQWKDQAIPEPGEGEILIRQIAAGLNYIDTYHRQGMFGLKEFPAIIGMEGAGIIEAIGPGCQMGFKEGQRVCYAGGPVGAYAQYRTITERHLIQIPDNLSKELAAAVMVKGLTAHYLIKRTYFVSDTTVMLVHAAAGGVGLLLCQWAKLLGATVIGAVGSEEKAELARQNGCDHVLLYPQDDIAARVKDITDGLGCHVVYDSVGKATFQASMDSLMPFGMLISYGEASGPVGPIELKELQKRGSLFLTRPSLDHYIQAHHEYVLASGTLLQLVSEGKLKLNIKQSYYLKDARRAHEDLEQRRTSGATIFYTEA